MSIYLLAINLFALTALLIGLASFSDSARYERLLPLFLLVLSRSLAFMVSLVSVAEIPVVAALEIFSTFCVIWALIGAVSQLGEAWRQLAWLGTAVASGLVGLSLLPGWPVPAPIHNLLIAIFGAPLIFMGLGKRYGLALAVPLILVLANFLSLFDLVGVFWFLNLLAYAVFVGAIHLQSLHDSVRSQQSAEALVQQAYDLNREGQRWLEVSEMISNVPNLSHSLEHIVQSMAQATHVDQAAIFVLNNKVHENMRLVTLYSPQHPFHITDPAEVSVSLTECPPLQQVITGQQQLILPQQNFDGLETLYELWNEGRSGPTLLQPLLVQGRPIGALMLGNPVTQQPIRERDARLCRNLAAQIATLVEHRRRYVELEREAEMMANTSKKQVRAPDELQLAILESVGDAIVVSNTIGRVQFVNQTAERILGKPGRALVGQSIRAIYREIDSREPSEDFVEAFSRRELVLPTFVEKEDCAIQGRLIPWRNRDNEWAGIIAVFRDMTREVKADRARDDFISALSRELRTPLTIVKGYAEMITHGMLDDYSTQQLQIMHIIHSHAEYMVEILDNAIRISAQNRHQVVPRLEEVSVTKIIESVLREIVPLARSYDIRLTHIIDSEAPTIAADPIHFHRILFNLLSNACRFTPPKGHVALRAWVQLFNWGRGTRPYLFITVTDNGVGIPKEETSRIFDRFYRLNNQNPAKRGGMGMGLTVVKELVELHNGRVWVESELGRGSIFHITLPVDQEY